MYGKKITSVLFALLAMCLLVVNVQAANAVAGAVAAAATWPAEPLEPGECNDTMPFKEEFRAGWIPQFALDIYTKFRSSKDYEADKDQFLLYPITDHFTKNVPESVKCTVLQECEVS
jgi:hypothetical protein